MSFIQETKQKIRDLEAQQETLGRQIKRELYTL